MSGRGDLVRIKRALELVAEGIVLHEYAKDQRQLPMLRAIGEGDWSEFDRLLDDEDRERERG